MFPELNSPIHPSVFRPLDSQESKNPQKRVVQESMSQAAPPILRSTQRVSCVVSLLSSKALLHGKNLLLVQVPELGKVLLDSELSFLHENCPVIVELSNYISSMEC